MTTLRARLALLVGLLTALAVSVVAVIGYQSTVTQLDHAQDNTLDNLIVGFRLNDPDGRSALELCQAAARTSTDSLSIDFVSGSGDSFQVQCIDTDGTFAASNGTVRLPVNADELKVASGASANHVRTVKVRGDERRIATVRVPFGAVQFALSTTERSNVLARLRTRYLLLVAGVSALAAAVGWLVTRRATAPITALTAATEQIASTGSLDVALPASQTDGDATTKDETRRLARSFTTMVDHLRQSQEQQARLVQDAGHELRTPLTSVRANVDVLRRHPDLAGPPRDRLLADLDSELRELTGLTNELVALSSATGADEPVTGVDLADIGRRAVERLQRRSDRPVVLDALAAPTAGRARLLQRAVDNLVDNAAKFSPSEQSIDITVRPGFVQVRDHGPGVPPEDLGRVFDRFYRSLASRGLPGSGLGLAIVKDVVTSHDGYVTVSNHPDDGGAVFTIHLPVPPPVGLPAPPAVDAYLG